MEPSLKSKALASDGASNGAAPNGAACLVDLILCEGEGGGKELSEDLSTRWIRALDMRHGGAHRDWAAMVRCSREFVDTATNIGERIINDAQSSDPCFRPKNLGGIAGGEKFIEKNILFKYANPLGGPYCESFELAAKAAGHDMKGACAFLQYGVEEGLTVALQALIDYSGYRLQAMLLLPLSDDSLKVGTGNACSTLPKADPEANAKMRRVAEKLHLAPHKIRSFAQKKKNKKANKKEGVELHFGCDVECHQGTDGRFYVLDTARTFPAECPATTTFDPSSPGKRLGHLPMAPDDLSIFWRLARPELLAHWAAHRYMDNSYICM